MEICQAFEVFNPAHMPEDKGSLQSYGTEQLATLAEQYGQSKGGQPAVIDKAGLSSEWQTFRHKLHKHRSDAILFNTTRGKSGRSPKQIAEEILATGAAPKNVHKLLCIKLVLPYSTSGLERAFSRMKLIKNYLRNRLYIETLDALMTVGLVGPEYASWEQGGSDFFETALQVWEAAALRNPKKARFGNTNAAKRRGHEARTPVPAASDSNPDLADGDCELDELADKDDEIAENVFQESTAGNFNCTRDIPAYVVLVGHVLEPCPDEVSNSLKRSKIAYLFEDGWQTGTFHGMYRGKKDEYKGFSTMYLDRKSSFYINLSCDNYGVNKEWVIISKA
jgi:hypothetical protein